MRSNTGRVVSVSTKRPIDKSLIYINQDFGTSQTAVDLLTVTYPCTIVGLRWDMIIQQVATVGTMNHIPGAWAIVLQREGLTLDTLGLANGTTLYNPEQQVLAFGSASLYLTQVAGDVVKNDKIHHSGATKTMRKMQGGDKLVLVCRSNVSDTPLNIGGAIQFFCKS